MAEQERRLWNEAQNLEGPEKAVRIEKAKDICKNYNKLLE